MASLPSDMSGYTAGVRPAGGSRLLTATISALPVSGSYLLITTLVSSLQLSPVLSVSHEGAGAFVREGPFCGEGISLLVAMATAWRKLGARGTRENIWALEIWYMLQAHAVVRAQPSTTWRSAGAAGCLSTCGESQGSRLSYPVYIGGYRRCRA